MEATKSTRCSHVKVVDIYTKNVWECHADLQEGTVALPSWGRWKFPNSDLCQLPMCSEGAVLCPLWKDTMATIVKYARFL